MCSHILQLSNNILKFHCNFRMSPRNQKVESVQRFWYGVMSLVFLLHLNSLQVVDQIIGVFSSVMYF